jgi:hypothetical protein
MWDRTMYFTTNTSNFQDKDRNNENFEARRTSLLKDVGGIRRESLYLQHTIPVLFYTSPGMLNESTKSLNQDVQIETAGSSVIEVIFLDYIAFNARRVCFFVSQIFDVPKETGN